jgi:hypothetical protein
MRQESNGQGRRRPVTTALLAAACAGMLSQTVQATPFVETADFGNTFAMRTTLPPGTDSVQGTLTNSGDIDDFFRLTGEPASQLVTLGYTASTTATNSSLQIQVFNDAGGFIGFTSRGFQPSDGIVSGSFQITVPADGVIVPNMNFSESGTGRLSYTLTVPEPSAAAALIGLGALALLGRRKSDAPKDQDPGQA